MKKKLILLTHGPVSKNEYRTFGIDYLKKSFDMTILEISPLITVNIMRLKDILSFQL